MSRVRIVRKRAKLRAMLGVRARLALLALILVGPLMFDRVRLLEQTRTTQVAAVSGEIATLAQRATDAARDVISSIEAVLRSSAYAYAAAAPSGRGCSVLRSSLRIHLPPSRAISVANADGVIICSTSSTFVGVDVSDRGYFHKAVKTRDFVVSDFLIGRYSGAGAIVAAYPVAAIDPGEKAVLLASINLDWLSDMMDHLAGRDGVSAALIDGEGTVLATPPDERSLVGGKFKRLASLPALADAPAGGEPVNLRDDVGRTISVARIPGTSARLVVTVDENQVTGAINRAIRTAYLQLALVCLFVLLGALLAAERLIVQPISLLTQMANQFGQGDWSARAALARLPSEFTPLARAFNAMAAQLGQRERELVASNNRLTVMASMDILSGLANRRGLQSRLDFEWMKGQQSCTALALMMIDVDYFKLFNDTYGHPEGDACLGRIGETLAEIAARTGGFAARYGGEEFCLLLPDTGMARAAQIGEIVRTTVDQLALPHRTSGFQRVTVSVGVACAIPNETASPDELIEAADIALYAAKHRGRNTVVEHGLIRGGEGESAIVVAG